MGCLTLPCVESDGDIATSQYPVITVLVKVDRFAPATIRAKPRINNSNLFASFFALFLFLASADLRLIVFFN
jgi:hypothetical protein